MKTCSRCTQEKPLERFSKDIRYKGGYKTICRDCVNARKKPAKPEQARKWNLKRFFGITPEQYQEMLSKQEGVCMICKEPPSKRDKWVLHIDHNHVTGKIRGLLCSSCNVGLGQFKDDKELLIKAAHYLEVSGI